MTWSIVARDPADRPSRHCRRQPLLRGRRCVPHIKRRAWAPSPRRPSSARSTAPTGCRCLAAGKAPDEIIDDLTARDDGRDQRQFHLIDAQGRNAAYHRRQLHRLGRPSGRRQRLRRRQHAGRPAGRSPRRLRAYRQGDAGKPLAERLLEAMAGRRGCRRRQARQAVRRPGRLSRSGLPLAEHPRRRSSRSARRTAPALCGSAGALPACRRNHGRPRQTRTA